MLQLKQEGVICYTKMVLLKSKGHTEDKRIPRETKRKTENPPRQQQTATESIATNEENDLGYGFVSPWVDFINTFPEICASSSESGVHR